MVYTVVLVTFNRLDCLKKTLMCYEKQSLMPKNIVIIDNASTDGTKDYLQQWKDNSKIENIFIIECETNTGGAGGFSRGVKEALKTECDFIFLADDDAYADENMISELDATYNSRSDKKEISALCTSVINYGEIDTNHRRVVHKKIFTIDRVKIQADTYKNGAFFLDEFSFVGVAVKKEIIQKIGLPEADYFIYFDDTEYSHRVRKTGKVLCVPQSIMNHNVAGGHDDNLITWRAYYSLRNSLDILRRYYPRRFFVYKVCTTYFRRCSEVSRVLKKRKKEETLLLKTAIKDAISGKIGKHEIYRPGR